VPSPFGKEELRGICPNDHPAKSPLTPLFKGGNRPPETIGSLLAEEGDLDPACGKNWGAGASPRGGGAGLRLGGAVILETMLMRRDTFRRGPAAAAAGHATAPQGSRGHGGVRNC